jgi:tricarballylate dehydrogenase
MTPQDPNTIWKTVDVLVVGGGNAALCAAMTAREGGADVLLLEASPWDFRGGNSRHTRNLRSIHKAANGFLTGPYLEDECFQDLWHVTKGNTNEEMARFVIRKSEDCVPWMQAHGVRFQPAMRGTLHLSRTNAFFLGGGKALINAYYATCQQLGVQVMYDAEVTDLEIVDGVFKSALVNQKGTRFRVGAKAVVLASGGYQGNLDWLREAWGPVADNFLIRGTPYDKGRMLRVMMTTGPRPSAIPPGALRGHRRPRAQVRRRHRHPHRLRPVQHHREQELRAVLRRR